jgi:hypothetical protein
MVKYMPYVVVALFIDGLKALVYWACFALGAGIAAVPIVGQVVGTVTIPLGIALGIALSICISITLGAGFLLLLAFNGLFNMRYAIGGGISGIIPILDILPGWTTMTILCILRKMKEEGELEGKASIAFATMVAPNTKMGAVYQGIKDINRDRVAGMRAVGSILPEEEVAAQESRRAVSTNLKSIDELPATKSKPQTEQKQQYAI